MTIDTAHPACFPRRLAGVLLSVALLAPGGPPAAAQTSEPSVPVFREKVEVATVDVLVLDQNGNPVPGLSQEDFTVKEDGVVQAVTRFEAVGFQESTTEAPRDVFVSANTADPVRPERAFLVIYDDLHLTPPGVLLARREFGKLVDGLAAGDVVSVVSTAKRTWWTARLPEGKDELLAFADGVTARKPLDLTAGRLSDWEAMQITYQRDAKVLGVVARRYFENGLIAEMTPPPNADPSYRRDLDITYGLPLIRAKATEQYDESSRRAQAAMETMKRSVAALGTQRGRKSVLVLSEGFVHDSTRIELKELVAAARDANAVLYFFDAKGSSGPNTPDHQAENWRELQERDFAVTATHFALDSEGTESAAYDTGGRVVKGTDNLADNMLKAVKESRTYYLLGYASTNTKRDGKFRDIKVSVARPGLEVRARKGYYAPRGDEKKPAPDKVDPRVRAGLDSPFDASQIPVRLASYVFGRNPSGKTAVLLAAELDLQGVGFERKGDRQVAALDTYAVVTPLEGGANQATEKRIDLSLPPDVHARLMKEGLPILREFELPAGRYQARLLVRDPRSGLVGTVRHTFEVPEAESYHISTPILSDRLAQGGGGGQLPVPVARRRFASGSPVFYLFDVYGVKPGASGHAEVAISYVVKRKDGTVFMDSPARPVSGGPGGALSHRLTLSLQGAEPGDYELLLTIEDKASGNRIERRDPFTVAAS